MAEGTLGEAAGAMGGELLAGDPSAPWRGAVLDSRQVTGGELFFALAGEVTDGHRFVADSLARGAAAAIVERDPEESAPGFDRSSGLIRVPSALDALHALTSDVRARLPEQLVAVTGSAGKTTTKELLARMLASRYRVAKNPGNLNNLFGFPISLLSIPEDTEWMVAEMGMSTPGELSRLAALGRPDFVVYTNVRPVHLEFFDDLRGIAEAKAELLEGLGPAGTVIANADDPEVVRIVARHPGKVIWYGRASVAPGDTECELDYGAEDVAEDGAGGIDFILCVGGERRAVSLPLYGSFHVDNFLAAAACAHTVGVSLDAIVASAAEVRPAAMRGELHRLAGERVVIDDSYNSNPDALGRALASVRRLAGRRHWAVLGSMLELGPGSPEFHLRAGEEAAELGFDPIVAVGEEARPLAEAAGGAGRRALWFAEAEEAAEFALGEMRDGDVLLVKGSRGVGLDRVVADLCGGTD